MAPQNVRIFPEPVKMLPCMERGTPWTGLK